METEIYEVLDGTGAGLRLQVEFQPRVNFSLGLSGIPFIRALVVHNETGTTLPGLDLSAVFAVTGAGERSWSTTVQGPIEPNGVIRIDDPRTFDVFVPLLSGATESAAATLDLRAASLGSAPIADGVGARLLAAVEVSAFNEFLNFPGLHASLATFVQPNTPAVTSILRAASDLLMRKTRSGSLEGYQGGEERAHQIAAAIYEALRGLEITYINPPASFERTGQKVRTTEQVLRERFGTCIDLAVLYAACLEAVGLFPVIFVTRNHAFTGFYTSEKYGETATLTQVNVLTNMVDLGLIRPVELTLMGPGRNSESFRDAVKLGTEYFRTNFDMLRTMIDVTKARLEGIRPMPAVGAEPAADPELLQQQVDADRPFVARSSMRNLTSVSEEEVVRGVLEREDLSPARFRNWKRDLLDLTLRNPLLNMPHTQKVLDLLVPGGMLPLLDDVVHSGKSVRVTGGLDSTELQKLAGIRVASEIAPDAMKALFQTTHTVFSTLPDEKHRKQLRAMKREADTLEQESGSNYLYLTLGTLVHTKADGKEARAPLFLLPVRLTGGLAFTNYSIKLDGSEVAQPNLCLLQWLTTTKGLDLTALASPALDDSGIAMGAVFSGIRQQLLDAELPYRLDESASLAILRFSTFQIWKDLEENWQPLMANPVVRHFVETPGETFADPAGSADPVLDEASLRLPIAADGSQMAAVVRATSGQSFVLEGPPGTGKSQTITNLIAHALTEGKKVLFVAEKQAALEVVARRLAAIGLGGFGLELHGAKQSMNSIREQLRAALETRVSVDQAAWDATNERLRTAIVALERYPELVHTPNAAGHSLWSAHEASLTLGAGPGASIPLPWLTTAPSVDVAQATRDYADAAARFGLYRGHHWLLSGASDVTGLELGAVQAALADVVSAHTRLASLGEPWRRAIVDLRPGSHLGAAVRLLAARDAGLLPSAGHVAYINRAAWREATAALTRDLAAYREKHADALALATPAAIESPELGGLIERSTKLDGAWLFPELRRKSLRKVIEPLLRGNPVPGDGFTAMLESLRAVRIEAEPLLAAHATIQGLITGAGWLPYADDAEARLASAIGTSQTAAWVATTAPAAWAILEATTSADADILRDLDNVWARWLGALGGSSTTVRHWEGDRDWLAAWQADEALWLRDLESTGLLQLQRFAETRRLLEVLRDVGLTAFSDQLASVAIAPADASEALLRGVATASLEERTNAGGLDAFDADAQDRSAAAYLAQGAISREQLRTAVAARLIAQRPFDVTNLRGEVAELKRQIDRKRGGLSFREVAKRYPRALTSVVPVFLMSPGSVAHFLDPDSIDFDLVIFDEASQIRVPQAIGAMGRGKAVVVVGDSRQMPPTRIMQVDASEDVDTSAEELVVEDLESILSEAVESGLPQLWLSWHYRSQDESLIAFSNRTYYDSKLVSLPSPRVGDGSGLSWRRVDGVFDRGRTRTNEVEAQAIVDEIAARLRDPATRDDSLGVVCFNIQQRDLILNKLEDSADLLIQAALTAAPGASLFVKNLENVQGDERDTILFSLAFSPDATTGILPLNFGPLNLSGGERRLNVAITRARKQVVLFSSFDSGDIDLKRTNARGIADLKHYLEFAATRSLAAGSTPDAIADNHGRFVEELAASIREAGFEVETGLGLSTFKVDIAVREPGSDEWRLAVMVDGAGWASRPTVSDRDGSPQLLVDLMGWSATVRVWLPGWLRDREGVITRIREAMAAPLPERAARAVAPQAPDATPGATPVGSPVVSPVASPDASAAAVPSAGAAADGGTVRADEPAQARSGLALPEFTPAADSVIASQSVLENMTMAAPAILRIASEALATEGPIPLDRLVATIARRFGLSRVGQAKRDDIASVVAGSFDTAEGFAWPADLDRETWRGARRSPSTAVRALAEISRQEIANAMELLVRESFSLTTDDLFRETAALLGYGRLTEQARETLAKGLELALSQERLASDEDRILMPA